jgi:hypothetical protein
MLPAGVTAMRDQYQDGLKWLLIAAGCVLLVACRSLANLMLARDLKDRAQTAERVAAGTVFPTMRGAFPHQKMSESHWMSSRSGV